MEMVVVAPAQSGHFFLFYYPVFRQFRLFRIVDRLPPFIQVHFGWWKQNWQEVHHYPWRPCPPPHAWKMWIIFVSTTSFLLYNSTLKASPFFCVWWERPWDVLYFFYICIFIREVVFLPTQSNSVSRRWIVIVVVSVDALVLLARYIIAFVAVVSPSFPSHLLRFTHTQMSWRPPARLYHIEMWGHLLGCHIHALCLLKNSPNAPLYILYIYIILYPTKQKFVRVGLTITHVSNLCECQG